MLSRCDRSIAYFYENPDTSTFRYRVFNMVEALNSSPQLGVSASWFSIGDSDRIHEFVDRCDALVICRTRFGPLVDRILNHAKRRNLPLFFDVDDLIFDADYIPLVMDSLGIDAESERTLENWYGNAARFACTLKHCGRGIATNAYLASKLRSAFPGIRTYTIPNFLNRLQQEHSEKIYQAKAQSHFGRDGTIHVGYFSGTPTHNRDFAIASEALATLMDEDPRVIMRVVGFLDSKGPIARHSDRVEIFPLQDFIHLQTLIGEVEISVAPLQNNAFTNCKSELKFFEAAIAGTLTIASPTFTFRQAIREGETGFLAAAHEWDFKLRLAIDAVGDAAAYRHIAERAHDFVAANYGWNRMANAIAHVVFERNYDRSSEPVSSLGRPNADRSEADSMMVLD